MTVRAFEFRGGSAAKFWHVSRTGTTVTVHFGRIGTAGRTKATDLAGEAAATAHLAKLVAEKLKKGYTEVAAPAAPALAPPAAVPDGPPDDGIDDDTDEDILVAPADWSQAVLPRRGGVPGPVVTVDAASVASAERRLAPVRGDVVAALQRDGCDPAALAEGRGYLADGLATATPLGVAVATAAIYLRDRRNPAEYFSADAWVAARGVVFAARVVAEWAGLAVRRHQAGESVCRCIRRDAEAPLVEGSAWRPWYGHAQAVRAHLASAADDEYAQACAALAEYRGGSLRQRAATSFLVPTETGWVDDDCRELATGGDGFISHVLWCAASTTGHLTALATPRMHVRSLVGSPGKLVTVADGAGQAFVPLLCRWFDTDDHLDGEERQQILSVLATLPGDGSFRALVERLDKKYAQPALLAAAKRYPKRAVRLLAEAAAGTSASARIAGDLLRAHVLGNPATVDAVLPQLDPPARERVVAIREGAVAVPDASADALPAVLVDPPWTAKRAAKPVVVAGLVRPDDSAIAWLPGERDEWRASEPRPYPRPMAEWEEQVDRYLKEPTRRDWIELTRQGPLELVRPLLAQYRGGFWTGSDWTQLIVGRFELDALPLVLREAHEDPATQGEFLLPYASAEVADLMAEWLARRKSMRTVALTWLARHPAAAARALIPAALGKPGRARRAAEQALHAVAAAGHQATVSDAARSYGSAAADAVEALLAADPLEVLPPKLPKLPDWLDPAVLPQVLLRGRGGALPRESVRHVCTMLAMSKPGEVYAGVDVVKQVCDPASLAEFAWAVFQRWQAAGLPSKEGWVLPALGWLGDDGTVRRLAPVIRAWPGEGGHARAVAGLDVLTAIGTDIALMHLHGIAQKVKFKGVRDRAGEKVAEVAADLGLTADELADRLVPDLGLDASGSLVLDYGPRQFTVGFDEHLKPYVADADGTRRKALPKPGARDDQELAPTAYQRFAAVKKDVRTIAADQITRLEQAMVNQRRWRAADFQRLLVAHPLLWHIVRRLVWATFDSGGDVRTTFRVAEDRTFADVDDDAVDLDDDTTVGVPHPVHLGDAVPAWGELFADYEILQPFPQLGREVHTLTDAERAAETLERFRSVKVPTTKLIGLQRRGWERGYPQDAGIQGWLERDVPHGRTVVVHLDPGIPVGMVDHWPEQQIAEICIHRTGSYAYDTSGTAAFGVLDPVTTSELLRDLIEVTS